MSAAIILSSSPSRVFARSPTYADSSPYLPSPAELLKIDSQSPKRFKTSVGTRDRFPEEFSGAHSLLSAKRGAENQQLRSAPYDNFKSLDLSPQQPKPKLGGRAGSQKQSPGRTDVGDQAHDTTKSKPGATPGNSTQTMNLASGKGQNAVFMSPESVLQKALPRRKDWTPLKDNVNASVSCSEFIQNASMSFPNGFMASFRLETSPEPEKNIQKTGDDSLQTIKRKRIEPVEAPSILQNTLGESGKKIQKQSSKKGTKSQAKKPMTITHLATSHYVGKGGASKDSPMMQYLNSTQVRDVDIADIDDIEVLSKVVPQRSKKPSTKKSHPKKNRLLSPKSAIQTFEGQETIFGSASQLVREQHAPARISLLSDPISPERTQPISIASTTPRTNHGTSRFVKTKNLWAAAGRDEDNALLHVEAIDLLDTPCMKSAFAGKDAMIAPGQSHRNQRPGYSATAIPFRSGNSPSSRIRQSSIFDVDEVRSPLAKHGSQIRPIHSVATVSTAGMVNTTAQVESDQQQSRNRVNTAETEPKSKAPLKPSYAGLDTGVLQKQLKAYGFKPVKKRERMIELLEMCWQAKYGKQDTTSDVRDDPLKHGDFLSKVHDVSSRPELKVKKPRKRTRARSDETSPVKQTKRRRKSDPPEQVGVKQPGLKKPRKSRSKTSVQNEETVNVVDDDAAVAGVPQLASNRDSKREIEAQTPPSALHALQLDESLVHDVEPVPEDSALQTALEGDVGEQIHAAILRQSQEAAKRDRNHVKDPTWHEKILMYDPIILEDLTTWLNTEGLNRVNEDREVSAFEVRTWCESNGICCLWKGGWRGQKARPSED